MKTMMITEAEPVGAPRKSTYARVSAETRPGVPARVLVHLTDAATRAPLTDLGRSHEVWMHLIVTREDLGRFPTCTRSRPVNPTHFDAPGLYRLWDQFRLADGRVITVPFTVVAG